jgi:hypothetical protein
MGVQYSQPTGLQPGTGTITDEPNLPRTNLIVLNFGTANAQFQYKSAQGGMGEPITLPPGTPLPIHGLELHKFWLSGNGSNVIMFATWPEDIDGQFLIALAATLQGPVSITGTVETDIKSVGGTTQPAGANFAADTNQLAQIGGAAQIIGGTPMLAVSVQDPPQQSVASGKGIPVKSET